ncbi:hypothetical protein H1Z61_12470 [Bacillus aquiflavi]|uniref:Uncharacterized protein n=1 Tax=Bacillus aquiflavi TaxID=2672567 RepID=A0A6B3VVU8_9BACI|nr:hypothetical protein [Bacillus aquiflavi]MBA4537923.1 hypothetical protein [Bacillus aquiflavi]NEY82179.1 hypothetical protein [Bacillus aquiflavi]UAC49256.1 hypothetical protein K6959_05125 [Bacillus aquiflavi]
MKSLQDSLYNWLTIKVVSDARQDDIAAQETKKLFDEILYNDHGLVDIEVTSDEIMYYIHFKQKGEQKKMRFPRELIEVMLEQINAEPEKYRNYDDID